MIKQRKITSKFFVFVFLVCFVYAGVVFAVQQNKIEQQKKELQVIESQIQEKKNQQSELEYRIDNTLSQEYVERIAREKLGWVKDDEIKFVERK
ncbi:MAG: FtsB family cell division protein [Christensenellales bacterium]